MRMKRLLFAVFVLSLLMAGCTSNTVDTGLSENDNPVEVDGIVITLPAWSETRAYSRYDLTTPELAIGEKVAVVDEEGSVYEFCVVGKVEGEIADDEDNIESEGGEDAENGTETPENPENKDSKDKEDKEDKDNKSNMDKSFVIENPNVELVVGKSYRVQYPYPEVTNFESFWMGLGFGGYASTPSLDWFVSKWHKCTKEGKLHFNLKRINSVLIFDIVAPFSGQIEEIRLSAEKVMFCIKGAFDSSQDDLPPIATTWTSQYKFPHNDMTWVQGEHYSLVLTVFPYDYSTEEYTLDIYTADNGVAATTPISIPKLEEGKIVEYQLSEFEILPAPVYEKDAMLEERNGYDVFNEWTEEGEEYL